MKKTMFIVFLALTLAACAPAQTDTTNTQNTALAIAQTDVALTQTAIPTATPTNTPTALPTPPLEATPTPTQPTVLVLTPDAIQVERWKEYQEELAKAVLSSNPELGNDPAVYKDALCEWDILGQSTQEIYVYVICAAAKGNGEMRRPAVIYLDSGRSIQGVKVAEYEGSFYDLGLFPADVQEKLCTYSPVSSQCPDVTYYPNYPRPRVDALYAHIKYRKTYLDEPPLVVLSATSTSTLTPTP